MRTAILPMTDSALTAPQFDPTPIFEFSRSHLASQILTAAVAHFDLFARLAKQPLASEELRGELELAERPASVLFTALRAMRLLACDDAGRIVLTASAAEHLVPGGKFYVGDYLSLIANEPGVRELVQRLRTNRPAGTDPQQAGPAFIYRAGERSAMDQEDLARRFTLALSGRAKNVAPLLARAVDLSSASLLLDVGGGTGIYSAALLQKHPRLKAIVFDRPEVLKVAAEFAESYGVADRMECRPGDMLSGDALPNADVVLLSNVLHDWDIAECRRLIARCAQALPPRGRLLIHDVFLNDALDGPLPAAIYSIAIFSVTEGRIYSGAEYRGWLSEAGLQAGTITPTLVHCGVLEGRKPAGDA
jgi:SAM-dependent methyltransferase